MSIRAVLIYNGACEGVETLESARPRRRRAASLLSMSRIAEAREMAARALRRCGDLGRAALGRAIADLLAERASLLRRLDYQLNKPSKLQSRTRKRETR